MDQAVQGFTSFHERMNPVNASMILFEISMDHERVLCYFILLILPHISEEKNSLQARERVLEPSPKQAGASLGS